MRTITTLTTLGLLAAMLASCEEGNGPSTQKTVRSIVYFQDPRSANLCYAQYGDPGWNNFSFTYVPCAAVPAHLLLHPQIEKGR